jgi:hypothetical protein
MLVGEQPGDQEDPVGVLCRASGPPSRRALKERISDQQPLRVRRSKHFKHEQRGKRQPADMK